MLKTRFIVIAEMTDGERVWPKSLRIKADSAKEAVEVFDRHGERKVPKGWRTKMVPPVVVLTDDATPYNLPMALGPGSTKETA